MCFNNNDDDEAPKPAPPPEVLQQEAPVVEKKTAEVVDPFKGNEEKTGTTKQQKDAGKTNPLAIGTKKYRNASGLGISSFSTTKTPTGIQV